MINFSRKISLTFINKYFSDTFTSAYGKAKKFEKTGAQCRFYTGRYPVKVDPDAFAYSKNSPIAYQSDYV